MAVGRALQILQPWRREICSCSLLGLLLLAAATAWPAQGQEPAAAVAGTRQSYPAIEQLAPLSTILGVEAAETRGLLDRRRDLSAYIVQADENQQTLLTLDQRLAGWGPVTQWSEGRLHSARQQLLAIRSRQQTQFDQLTASFSAIEEIRNGWTEKQSFWDGWQQELKQGRIKIDAELFRKNQAVVRDVLARAADTATAVGEVRQRLSAQQEIVAAWIAQIDAALASLRGPLFSQNGPPLLSDGFFRQINHSLWVGLDDDLDSALSMPADFAPRHGWVILLQLLLTLTIAWELYRRTRQAEPVTEQWRFLFRHPLAGAFFIVLVGSSFLYISPPMFWRWGQLVFGTTAATVLICAMLERPRLRRVIIVLAALFICSTTIQLIGLVQPLHRLFLVGVGVIATPLCLAAARRQRQRRDGRLDLLATAFYLGTLAGAVSLLAQLAGFHSLSAYLVRVFLGSTFIVLLARMAMHLGDGGINALFASAGVRERRFVQQLGPGIVPRLKILWHVIVIANAGLYLLVRWDIYPTTGEAWTGLRAQSFTIGELQISVEIILMTVFVLYLTFIFSWILQALLDAEVMTPQGMEHGVKIAVKTLIHYSLILLGFLVAISVAGIDMSKFAILAGALGVGIGFGLQNIVNNFISGLILLFERPVKVGDMISLEEQWGTITRIGLRSTVVETFDRAEVIVPNSELIAQRVTNWTFTSSMARVVLSLGVAYGTPLEKVIDLLLQVAREHPGILADPEPSAIFAGFGESAIDFELRAWIANVDDRLRIRSELGLAIDRRFREAGIVIPFPQRDLHLQSIAPNLQGIVPPAGNGTAKPAEDSVE